MASSRLARKLKEPERQLTIIAAVAGQGLALVHDVDAEEPLRSETLVRPLTTSWPAEIAYYAVAAPESLRKPAVRRFRDWLVEEACGEPNGSFVG
ncbi:MAG: hypothetical protein JOY83_18535 [Alphaproteobacteria bacterium]|nr:hypothetical protein [Alphaproteobacteria bacterium]